MDILPMVAVLVLLCSGCGICSAVQEGHADFFMVSNVSTMTLEVSTESSPEVSTEEPITCQEGPDAGSAANQTCNCGSHGYFYGDLCEFVNLDAVDDINTSKRVMEIQWLTNPNFTRDYTFLYRVVDSNEEPVENPSRQPVNLKETPEYFYTWLIHLKSGQVEYVVCVLEKSTVDEICDKKEWSRINTRYQDCHKIQTENTVTESMTIAAILVGVIMVITLVTIFAASLCTGRQQRTGLDTQEEDHYSQYSDYSGSVAYIETLDQPGVFTRDFSVKYDDYVDKYDQV